MKGWYTLLVLLLFADKEMMKMLSLESEAWSSTKVGAILEFQ